MIRALAIACAVSLAACKRQPATPQPSPTVLGPEALGYIVLARELAEDTAAIPAVQSDPVACRVQTGLVGLAAELEAVGQLDALDPAGLPRICFDMTHCPAIPGRELGESVLSEEATLLAARVDQQMESFVVAAELAYPLVPPSTAAAWTALSTRRILAYREAILDELVSPDDVVCVAAVTAD